MAAVSETQRVMTLDEVRTDKAEGGPLYLPSWQGWWPAGRNANPRAATALPLPRLSDTTGAYEVTLFSETLEKSREYLDVPAPRLL